MEDDRAICTKCDGLGQRRWKFENVQPQSNVANWHRNEAERRYERACNYCDGTGFRPRGSSGVPVTLKTPVRSASQG